MKSEHDKMSTNIAAIGTLLFALLVFVVLALLIFSCSAKKPPRQTTIIEVSDGRVPAGTLVKVSGYFYDDYKLGWLIIGEDDAWVKLKRNGDVRIEDDTWLSVTGVVQYDSKHKRWLISNPQFFRASALRAEARPSILKIVDKR